MIKQQKFILSAQQPWQFLLHPRPLKWRTKCLLFCRSHSNAPYTLL